MRVLFITFLLLAFYGNARCWGVDPSVYQVPHYYAPQVYAAPLYAPAPTIYVPQVQMVPYRLDRTEVVPQHYRTPLRDLLFGRYRINNYYVPQEPTR